MKEIGVFFGNDNNRNAKVYKDDDKYLVTVKNASGVYFTQNIRDWKRQKIMQKIGY